MATSDSTEAFITILVFILIIVAVIMCICQFNSDAVRERERTSNLMYGKWYNLNVCPTNLTKNSKSHVNKIITKKNLNKNNWGTCLITFSFLHSTVNLILFLCVLNLCCSTIYIHLETKRIFSTFLYGPYSITWSANCTTVIF